METLQVEIISPTEAKELNPFGIIKPQRTGDMFHLPENFYEQAEQKRRVFKIVGQKYYDKIEHGKFHNLIPFTLNHDKKKGDICKAEIDSENLTCIIK